MRRVRAERCHAGLHHEGREEEFQKHLLRIVLVLVVVLVLGCSERPFENEDEREDEDD
jgi:hypothetical protein